MKAEVTVEKGVYIIRIFSEDGYSDAFVVDELHLQNYRCRCGRRTKKEAKNEDLRFAVETCRR